VKEEALALLDNVADPAQKLNVLREYLQVLVLRSLHESEAFTRLAFVGGSALRFAFRLPRFSEDIDFALEDADGYRPEAWLKKLKHDLALGGFDASVSFKDKTTVHKSWIKIAGILKEVGLAAMEDQKLSIKLEIDTCPPVGATCERTLISHHRMLALRYYDLASLMAGKVHALLTRRYAKGRDWYDLLWYLGRRPPMEPNLRQLQNALDQTQGDDTMLAPRWRAMLLARIERLDCSVLQDDVRPFLERENEASLLTPSTIRVALGGTGAS
jgi:predicted nucleotidyltransferase component of viral defense system